MSSLSSEPPLSRTDWVTGQLREAIVAGELAPGERLLPREIERRYKVSATPVREAIQRLTAERLVDAVPQRGATVVGLDPREMEHIYELRLQLEPMAAERSVVRARDDRLWVAEVDRTFARVVEDEAHLLHEMNPARTAAHNGFHHAIRSRCDSAWLLHFVDQLALHSERYRRLRLSAEQLPSIHHEHAELHAACKALDAGRVRALTEEHLARTLAVARARHTSAMSDTRGARPDC